MMRRSSGMGGARALRSLGRSVLTSAKDNLSPSKNVKPPRVVSVTTPPSLTSSCSLTCLCDGDEWEAIGDGDFGTSATATSAGFGFGDQYPFGPVPSEEETELAVSAMQQIFVPVTFSQFPEVEHPLADEDVVDKEVTGSNALHSSTESVSDWIEPALHISSSKFSQSYGEENILDVVRLMHANPPFKRMVTSLSSDPHVWDAVMKNEVVQELKKSYYKAERRESSVLDKNDDIPTGILRWIMESTKGKIMEFFNKISKLANDLFQSREKDTELDLLGDFVKSSFLLSIVVLIIVVITRIQKA